MPKQKLESNEVALSPELLLLKQGLGGAFWLTLKKLLQKDIDAITEDILERDDLSGAPKQMTLRDIARLERSKMIWFRDYIENKIAKESVKTIEEDPDDK